MWYYRPTQGDVKACWAAQGFSSISAQPQSSALVAMGSGSPNTCPVMLAVLGLCKGFRQFPATVTN